MTSRRFAFLLLAVFGVGTGITATAQGQPATPAAVATRTWTDADLEKLMKEIGATVAVLRKSIEGQNVEMAREQAEKVESLFEQVDDFWSARNVRDAVDTADDAAEHAEHIADALDGKDFAKAGEHMKLLQGTCASCHGKYRDKGPDGNYRIKP
jgi:hypothetical protein